MFYDENVYFLRWTRRGKICGSVIKSLYYSQDSVEAQILCVSWE